MGMEMEQMVEVEVEVVEEGEDGGRWVLETMAGIPPPEPPPFHPAGLPFLLLPPIPPG